MRARPIAITLALLSAAAPTAIAGPAIKDFASIPISAPATATYGFSFFLLAPETITGLGAYDGGNPGLAGSAQVGLWDADGNLLASTTVSSGSAGILIGDYSYAAIAPVTLAALTLYYIGSLQPSDPISYLNESDFGSPPVDDNVVVNADAYTTGPSLAFPGDSTGTAGAFLGANFTDSNVPAYAGLPEPATLVILGTSLAGFASFRRRNLRQ